MTAFSEDGATQNELALRERFEHHRRQIDDALNQLGPLRAELDQTVTALNMLSETVLAASANDGPFEKVIEKLQAVDLTFLRKLEAFFYPMLENANPPLGGHEVATKEYVDRALERLAVRLREHVRDLLAKPAAKPSRLAALVFAITGRQVPT